MIDIKQGTAGNPDNQPSDVYRWCPHCGCWTYQGATTGGYYCKDCNRWNYYGETTGS